MDIWHRWTTPTGRSSRRSAPTAGCPCAPRPTSYTSPGPARTPGWRASRGPAAQVDPVRYGYGLSAYVYVDIAQRSWKSVRGQLLAMPAVDHVALLSGEHDILLRVRARDAVSLRDVVLSRLQEIPEVRSTQTVLIFEEATPHR